MSEGSDHRKSILKILYPCRAQCTIYMKRAYGKYAASSSNWTTSVHHKHVLEYSKTLRKHKRHKATATWNGKAGEGRVELEWGCNRAYRRRLGMEHFWAGVLRISFLGFGGIGVWGCTLITFGLLGKFGKCDGFLGFLGAIRCWKQIASLERRPIQDHPTETSGLKWSSGPVKQSMCSMMYSVHEDLTCALESIMASIIGTWRVLSLSVIYGLNTDCGTPGKARPVDVYPHVPCLL